MANKLKSILTGLGIIFGVAAVISMLAIGTGARQEIMEQIKLVGVNNIIVKPIEKKSNAESEEESGKTEVKKFSRGLTIHDLSAIKEILPDINYISSEILLETSAIRNSIKKPVKLVGIDNDYFRIFNIDVHEGTEFTQFHSENGANVCVIGSEIKNKFFNNKNPIGETIKCGNIWLNVIGVIETKKTTTNSTESLGISNINEQIFIPVKTMLLRYKNKALINSKLFNQRRGRGRNSNSNNSSSEDSKNYHQLDKIIVQVSEPEFLTESSKVIERILLRRHSGVSDFEIIVPELLLKQQQRTKDIFNIVLGAIASISLIVGGIGIMNIMLASVMERIKEIGTRLAIGATKKDIVIQFLAESTMLSIVGGVIGVILGFIFSKLIMEFAGILTIITPISIIISFGISAMVGIIFGYMPAKKAAEKDPVESLRYE